MVAVVREPLVMVTTAHNFVGVSTGTWWGVATVDLVEVGEVYHALRVADEAPVCNSNGGSYIVLRRSVASLACRPCRHCYPDGDR